MSSTRSFSQCVSSAEKRQRFSVSMTNGLLWLLILVGVVASMGVLVLVAASGWLVRWILSEYNVRRIQALGATVSAQQFPEVHQATADLCQEFGVATMPRVVILGYSQVNALALRFARQRVIVIFAELLETIIDRPQELRFLLAHELCHTGLDHGWRGVFELVKTPRYRQARELTCDNAGLAAAADIEAAKNVVKKLCVGKHLFARLQEGALESEAEQIYSGFSGWLVSRHLSHPPAGTRLHNLSGFAELCGAPRLAAQANQVPTSA